MSFFASEDQVRAFEEFSSKPSFSQEAITVDFTPTTEYVRSVLPPGLEPGDTPTGHILLATMESKLCGKFDCAIVSLDAKFRGKAGTVMLEIIISNDLPVTWGREVWGEAKKTGTCRLWRSGDWRYAYAERNGVRLIEMQAKFGEDLPPGGRLTIRGTTADPLHSIPIESVSDFKYTTGRADYTVASVEELGVGEAYLPHLIGRHYEDVRVHKVGAEWTELKDEELEEESYPVRRFFTPGFKN
ncbi:acetoacetate decarboxylase [Fusarium bulbicola]|nr:acetoacetate decarboxylase [Fusarium bulbicola]